jgi:integrase
MSLEYSPSTWAGLKKNENTQNNRWHSLLLFANCYGYQGPMADHESIEKVCVYQRDLILKKVSDPYGAARQLRDYLTDTRNLASGTASGTLSRVREWFTISGIPTIDEIWSVKVDPPSNHREKDKGLLTEAGVKLLIRGSELDDQALYETLATTGARISEALAVKAKDLDLTTVPEVPLVLLRKSKTDTPRRAPLSQECYKLVQDIRGKQPESLIFSRCGSSGAVYERTHYKMEKLKLTERKEWLRGGGESWNVSLHNFRQFSEDHMVNHGMQEGEAAWLVGRQASIGSRSAYHTIERLAPLWKERVEPYTHWLDKA